MTFIWRYLLSLVVIVDKWLWKTNSVDCGLCKGKVILFRVASDVETIVLVSMAVVNTTCTYQILNHHSMVLG